MNSKLHQSRVLLALLGIGQLFIAYTSGLSHNPSLLLTLTSQVWLTTITWFPAPALANSGQAFYFVSLRSRNPSRPIGISRFSKRNGFYRSTKRIKITAKGRDFHRKKRIDLCPRRD